MLINKKRIININNYPTTKENKIGVMITDENYNKVGIKEFVDGLSIIPSYKLGPTCRKNSLGYSIADKSKPKVNKIVNTIEWTWEQWIGRGETETCSKIVDIEREVYQRIEFPPKLIHFICKSFDGRKYLIADMPEESNTEIYKHTINMFLETFGYCQIFDKKYNFSVDQAKIKYCNWVILPKGMKIIIDNKRREKKENDNKKRRDFNQSRLDFLQQSNYNDIYVGEHGFDGYFVFKYDKLCILENGFYGNATYIIPALSWEELTKKTKQELISESLLVDRIVHQASWFKDIKKYL